MKRLVLYSSILGLLFTACEEVPPFIDFTPIPEVKTYISPNIPPAQHKAVLIEDITGVRCNNCPQAAQKAKDIVTAKTEDSVVVMALYSGDYLSNFTSPWPGFTILNSPYSSQIISQLGIPQGLPSGYVDRNKFGSADVRYNPFQNWATYTNERLRIATPVNINLHDTLIGRKLTVDMQLIYTASVSVKHKWALYITESGIVSKQTTLTSYDDNYVHNHVLRAALGNAVGNPLDAPLQPGRTFETQKTFELPADYNPAKCHIVCVVSDAVTEAVVNVRQIDIL